MILKPTKPPDPSCWDSSTTTHPHRNNRASTSTSPNPSTSTSTSTSTGYAQASLPPPVPPPVSPAAVRGGGGGGGGHVVSKHRPKYWKGRMRQHAREIPIMLSLTSLAQDLTQLLKYVHLDNTSSDIQL
ncbi:hypothetical protein BU24DRAFT_460362 [Aaosphaeria arxii CBS 175.79]|uniref:Uncharacterized protein n=1 Tax=Aaosphaeria arxii CBS 175.79 TaxID=1450172 RepID=A0A6A5XWS3_9PLEO|nr:uncharacterized protein BU24DRAFT_460362 [Aaosphaeria arxii CBS 175.79]KAF2017297.1 hypothetical protein BU24DRAFT_460362 [Aaosphaeria arxii CBS 175.79]